MTAVRLHLTSGEQRVIDKADGALLNDPFFIITHRYTRIFFDVEISREIAIIS
jgi:hypothetical protein